MMALRGRPGIFGKALAWLAGAVLLALALMFSLVLIVVVAVVGVLAGGYFWWRGRTLRSADRPPPSGGQVFDGEATVVDDIGESAPAVLPPDPDSRSR